MSATDFPLPQLNAGDPFNAGDLAFSESPIEPPSTKSRAELAQIMDVPVTVTAVLGHVRLPVGDLFRIGTGSVLELDRKVGEAVDILVNERLVARGEVVLVQDRIGVTMTEIVKPAV